MYEALETLHELSKCYESMSFWIKAFFLVFLLFFLILFLPLFAIIATIIIHNKWPGLVTHHLQARYETELQVLLSKNQE